jgi:hypothetical protein
VTGAKQDSLNLLVTDKQPEMTDGASFPDHNGVAMSYNDASGLGEGNGPRSTNIGVLSNVFEHELGQQFLGGGKSASVGQDFERQFEIDPRNTFQGWGASQSAYRTGLETRGFAVQTNPEANTPKQ